MAMHVVIYSCTYRMTHTREGKAMHAETDQATYWQTMARLTGHTVRYLKVRAWVRATVATCAVVIPFTALLPIK